jgi:DNA polymerase-3 subunit alpha
MTESPSFIHLKVHSEYSLTDGLVKVPELINKTVELSQPAVALTDLTNFYALIKFYSGAIAKGLKPICGCDLLVTGDKDEQSTSLLSLLIKNNQGYQNLIKIISKSYQEGQRRGKVHTQAQWVEEYSDGLIALSGAGAGNIGQALLNEDTDQAKAYLEHWMKVFPDSFYLELQRTERPREEAYIHGAFDLAVEFDCPLVATNDVRFLTADEFEAHEARVCINDRRTLDDPRRPRLYSDNHKRRWQ